MGPRAVVSVEGARSYGLGLARALSVTGLQVVECEQPARGQRRGKGKSDPIDGHLAVLSVLRLDADRLPSPRADGDREALRILLGARHDLTVGSTAQRNRLHALLLGGDDTDRRASRGALTQRTLLVLARRRVPGQSGLEATIRRAEIRRLALALHQSARELRANLRQLQDLVEVISPRG